MAGYDNTSSSAWMGIQAYPTARAEVFANFAWNRAVATITDFAYDGGEYTAQMVGLDYPLHSATMASFSNLEFTRIGVNGGMNFRVSDPLVVNVTVDYSKYDDKEPYLFSVTGSHARVFGGVTWVF
ncbi:MAG: hypothetical protein Q8T13_20420 [Acidobacteriota bacterium]|nr:hypothetical protein [Acidobacteriota bacterium]